MTRALRIRDRGEVTRRHEADPLLEHAGDFVLVRRGVLRSFVLRCPDGCGDNLTINLDPRSDKAWRFYRKRRQVSLFPSVWRDSGCGSHFILWNHTILWCGGIWEENDVPNENPPDLRNRVLARCNEEWRHFSVIAEDLDEVPWDVNRECEYLARRLRLLIEGTGDLKGHFRKPSPSASS